MSEKCEGCGAAGAEPLYLHGRCHLNAPTWAVLLDDVLTIQCAKCGKVVARFRVKEQISNA